MDDPRGGITTETTHEVITLAYAKKWHYAVKQEDLPIKIVQNKTGDGRLHIEIYDREGKLMHEEVKKGPIGM